MEDNIGYLEVILGPMFSGKTTYLVELYNKYKQLDKNVIAVNFVNDTRYHDTMLSTHDKVMIPCIQCNHLHDIIHNNEIVKEISLNNMLFAIKKMKDIKEQNIDKIPEWYMNMLC